MAAGPVAAPASAVVMGSPGPSTISATAVAAAYGFRRALLYAGGLMLGTGAVLLAVAVGLVAVLLSIPHGAPVLVGLSGVYMPCLAVNLCLASGLAATAVVSVLGEAW